MKTAIQHLIEDFKESGYRLAAIKAMHYLELEKKQIIDSFNNGCYCEADIEDGEDFYDKKYQNEAAT